MPVTQPLKLTLRQLQIFCAVAERGSTTAAGDAIALSQSATSAAVNELERVLALPLFDRIGKRLLLNENGRALLPRAQALIQGALGIEHLAYSERLQLQELRIGASTTIGTYLLPRVLGQFLGDEVQSGADPWRSAVVIGNTAVICESVARFELDIGLIEGPCHIPELAVTSWLIDDLVIVQSATKPQVHPEGGKPDVRVQLKALRSLTWLLREPGSGTREAVDELLLPHLKTYRRSMALGSSEAIKHAVVEGIGVACLSRWVVRDLLEAGELAEVHTNLRGLTRECNWVVHRDKQPTAALRRFLEQLVTATPTGPRAWVASPDN
jgi:DNA-binding transcriptional LysR family regulator